ncbi:hypothetical protein Tco_1141664 [Tanacetum coccineum]
METASGIPLTLSKFQGDDVTIFCDDVKVADLKKHIEDSAGRYESAQNEEVDILIGDQILQPKESFRYLGSVIHKSGRIGDNVTHHIRAGVAIRPAILYGSECRLIMKAEANRMEVAELRMLR